MSDGIDVPELIKQIGNTDLGDTLLRVLKVVGLPTLTTNKVLGAGVQGAYTPADNNIGLSWSLGLPNIAGTSKNPELLPTVAHELTHAAMHRMSETMYDPQSGFPKDVRSEIEKFSISRDELPIQKLINKADDDPYRSSWAERLAFGVGNTIAPMTGNKSIRPVSHADATSATEFAIQSDLFLRGIKQMIGKK